MPTLTAQRRKRNQGNVVIPRERGFAVGAPRAAANVILIVNRPINQDIQKTANQRTKGKQRQNDKKIRAQHNFKCNRSAKSRLRGSLSLIILKAYLAVPSGMQISSFRVVAIAELISASVSKPVYTLASSGHADSGKPC